MKRTCRSIVSAGTNENMKKIIGRNPGLDERK